MMKNRLMAVLAGAALLLANQTAEAHEAHEVRDGISAYRHGSYPQAVEILKPLAHEGDPYAQFAIAVMYDDGLGLPQDFSRAISWYTRAAEAGIVDAQYIVGRFYGRGRGVKQNPGKAFYWFNLAAAAGHPLAPRLRDQHRLQLPVPQRHRIEAEAVAWQSAHPNTLNCDSRLCIYPGWTIKPRRNLFEAQSLTPR